MKLIKLNDKFKTIINLSNIEFMNAKSVEGSNPYSLLCIGFVSGRYVEVRYEPYEEKKLSEDINKLNSMCE